MPNLKINNIEITVAPGTLLLDACAQAGIDIPRYCYHPALSPVATCRMCMVEVKGQPKLATSCTTPAMEGQEVFTNTPSVVDARAGVMEFLLMNHPLDCPICDQAGECRLQDYSYQYGSGDSRMVEPKRRYRYEDLGARIVIDKNRCIHCTRCIRFTREISGTGELTVANRGAELEVTTYSGRSMDENPLAGNVVDLCPVGALTSRDFRFNKRVWYLKPVPTISRHSAMASPDLGRRGPEPGVALPAPSRARPRRHLVHHRPRALRLPPLRPRPRRPDGAPRPARRRRHLRGGGPGARGCRPRGRGGPGHLRLRHGPAGRRRWPPTTCASAAASAGSPSSSPPSSPARTGSSTGAAWWSGATGSDSWTNCWRGSARARSGPWCSLHDGEHSTPAETAKLEEILEAARFSLVMEPFPGPLSDLGTARLPVATYLEENDFVVNHEGVLRCYKKALDPPKGVRPIVDWARDLQKEAKAIPV